MTTYQANGEVVKNNSFIRCENKLTSVQRKSFSVMLKESIDTINEKGKQDFYFMPLTEYRKIMGYSDAIPTKQIREDLKELMTKVIEWDLDTQGYGKASIMLAGFELEKGKGILKWEFSNTLLNKLTEEGYTPLKLSIILGFNSKYALALYENLQMRKNFKKTSFTLPEFKALMGVESNEYKQMCHFKKRVIQPSINEINDKGDMFINYKDIKQGAKIVGLEFQWENLTAEKVKERSKRRELIEQYRKQLATNYGKKFKIANKIYTFDKNGFIYRGKNLGGAKDIVESYEQYQALKKQGLVEELKTL